jgi:Tol biopolymer transport system component
MSNSFTSVLGPALIACVLSPWVAAQSTARVSVSTGGVQGNATSYGPSLSADGRYVAFESTASNLVAGDTNGFLDVFVHDRFTGATTIASLGSGGAQGNQHSYECSISGNGRYVAFKSQATNFAAGDTNGGTDIFVRDMQTNTLVCASVTPSGAVGDNGCELPWISANGRYVAFDSDATNLVPGDTNGKTDIFVRDLQTNTTTLVSVDSNGVQGDDGSFIPSLSADGRYVAFSSYATNLVANDNNFQIDTFVHDRQTGTTLRVSVDATGSESNGYSYFPALSGDGRFVAFYCAGDNLVPNDTNFADDIFVKDLTTGAIERVSVDSNGNEGDDSCDGPSMSYDGRYVAFFSYATNLVASDTNGALDAFLHDRVTGTTTMIDVDTGGIQGNSDGENPSISDDGRFIAFDSDASNLVAGDTNGSFDVFVRDQGAGAPSAYCTAGTTSSGCVPSISGTGTPSASAGSGFTIAVGAVEGAKQGILFYGLDNTGFTPTPWGASSSYLCVKAPTQRTGAQNSGGSFGACNGTLSLDWNAYIASNAGALGNPFTSGQTVYAQGWFRDPPSPKTTNLSNALQFSVGP